MSACVHLARLDATSDAEINHQRIAELVEDVLQSTRNSVPDLAQALHISPSTIPGGDAAAHPP